MGEKNEIADNLGEDIIPCEAWIESHVFWRQEVSHATDIAILIVGSLSAYQMPMATFEHSHTCFTACAQAFTA